MASVGNRVNEVMPAHPDPAVLEVLAAAPVANIGDVMQRLYSPDAGIRALNAHRLAGPAVTVRVPTGDNLVIHAVMDSLRHGDVLVVDAEGSTARAVMGDLMLQYLATKGIAGVVVDGCVRDLDYIAGECPFAVYARGTNPNGPYKNGPGEINYPVAIGGVVVNPGDLVCGDADGIVVVPAAEAAAVAEETAAVVAKEGRISERIRSEGVFDRPWVDAQMARIGSVSI